ncbi:hypothetical protein R55227_BLOPHJLP_00670 [Fructobacillus tropaeoli]|uniref:O-antigen polymerase n=2 Tax=Fructobacillus tropaeoli TaxID=709323 RepID=A0ABM9MRD0_9LACO|nr:hypothetical protein R53137_KAKDMLNK_00473 [Fructobacillus tropaeoli]CAK1236417.1 hypothetical protein R55227_BLOPHJLP_00670 [Fructobacillus tropaeoli]CAK1250230.1 hypothetical protein LMG30237_ALEAABJJ_01274 [Fructobacillus tropaeoli]
MVNFLLPITFFSKTYSYSLAEPMAMISLPVFILIILLQLFRFPERLSRIIPSIKAVLLGAFFWLSQMVAMFFSYTKTGESQLTSGIVHSGILLFGWTLAVYIAWAVLQVTINSEEDEKKFIKSGLIGLICYLIFVIFPQLLVTFHFTKFNLYVNDLASLFEQRWRSFSGYDFNASGAYSLSQNRINGFEPEASYLANLLGIAYLPILIGVTVGGQKIWRFLRDAKYQVFINSLFTLVVVFVLVLAKTTTGILIAIVAYLLWIFWAKGKLKQALIITLVIGLLGLTIAYTNVHLIHQLLNQFLFAKQNTDNRLGGSIGLALTFLNHPLIGVGSGFTSFYTIQNVPISATHNFEFQQVYSQYGFPILSEFLGWMASFGLVIMLPAFWLLARLIMKSFLVQKKVISLNATKIDQNWASSMHVSFITMVILVAFSSIFIIRVYLWPYLLMFFFYRKHIMRLEEELQ